MAKLLPIMGKVEILSCQITKLLARTAEFGWIAMVAKVSRVLEHIGALRIREGRPEVEARASRNVDRLLTVYCNATSSW